MWLTAAVVGILVLAIVAAVLFERRRLSKKRARFIDRQSVQLSEIFETYYRNLGVTESKFQEIWCNAAAILKLDPTKLRPSDRFDAELAPVKGHLAEDELVDLQEYYSAECKRLRLANAPRLQTLGDLVQTLSASAGK